MHWEELTAAEFPEAVRKSKGVCLVPVGCVEKHGNHLPLGTDFIFVKYLCGRAAEIEPAVVFPPYYLGQINCARHCPGTIAIRHNLLMDLLEACCDEIARNGFDKIILVNGHGGNTHFLRFFCQITLERQRDYTVFMHPIVPPSPEVKAMLESTVDGHAGEIETSRMMVVRPDLVKMDLLSSDRSDGLPRGRMRAFDEKLFNAMFWYADFPTHYAGQAKLSSPEKGKALIEDRVNKLVKAIRLVKTDDTPAKLQAEFFSKCVHRFL